MRFLTYTLADPSVPIPPPSQEDMARMGEFMAEVAKAGVLVATGGVGPLDEAVKVQYHGGEYTVLDGPFTEAKELVGGWALLRLVAGLARYTGDVGLAEELAQDAVVAALEVVAGSRGPPQPRCLADHGGQAAGRRTPSAATATWSASTPSSGGNWPLRPAAGRPNSTGPPRAPSTTTCCG